jgi:hypothetical protein
LSYIVSHLRERALTNDWRYILATIYDGQNNIKEKKTPIFGVEKGKARKKTPSVPLLRGRNHPDSRPPQSPCLGGGTIRIQVYLNMNYHELIMNFS